MDKYESASDVWTLSDLIRMIFISWTIDTRLRNPDKLLSNLQYNDAVAEAQAAGYEYPPSTTEMFQQAIIAFSRMENQHELVAQEDEDKEEEKEGDEFLDIDGARLSYSF